MLLGGMCPILVVKSAKFTEREAFRAILFTGWNKRLHYIRTVSCVALCRQPVKLVILEVSFHTPVENIWP